MSVKTSCPNCGRAYNLADNLEGKKIRCKECDEVFLVEREEEPLEVEEVEAEPLADREVPRRGPAPEDEADEEEYEDDEDEHEDEEEYEDDEEAYEDEGERRAKSSTRQVLLIVGGVLGGLLLVCCGVGGFVGYQVYRDFKEAREQFQVKMNDPEVQKQFEAEVKKFVEEVEKADAEAAPAPPGRPANLDEALADLNNDGASRRRAAEWLAKAPLNADRQNEVARRLEQLLSDGDGQMRLAVLKALQVWATKDNVPALLRVLEEDDDAFDLTAKQEAMGVLGQLKDERGAEVIARFLPHAAVGEQAKQALQKIGPAAQKAVLPYYHHPDGEARGRARDLIRGYGTPESAVLAQTLEDARSIEVVRRRQAAEWLAQAKPTDSARPQVGPVLEGLINDADPAISEAGMKALTIWADQQSVPMLVRLVNSPAADPHSLRLRHQAMATLGRLKDERGAAPVAARLTNPVDRPVAVKALTAMGPVAEKEVARYLENPDLAVRTEASKILKEIGSKTNVELIQALADLKSSEFPRRLEAARKLEQLPVDEGRRAEVAKALEQLLADGTPATGQEAGAKALVNWATKDNVPALLKQLDHPSPAIRHPAMEALGKLKDERAITPLAQHLTNRDDRPHAARALQAMGPMAENEVLKYLPFPDVQVRIEACKVLKVIGTKASLPHLQATGKMAAANKQKHVVQAVDEAVQAINARPDRSSNK